MVQDNGQDNVTPAKLHGETTRELDGGPAGPRVSTSRGEVDHGSLHVAHEQSNRRVHLDARHLDVGVQVDNMKPELLIGMYFSTG